MKKLLLIFVILLISCSKDDYSDTNATNETGVTGVTVYTDGNQIYYLEPQGRCYIYDSNGDKSYVDRSYCN